MSKNSVYEGVRQLRQSMEARGYSRGRLLQFNSTTNQLLKFMATNGIQEFCIDTGIKFLGEHYGFKPDGTLSRVNKSRLQDLTMLSELQLHGTFVPRCRNGRYHFPEAFKATAEEFLAHRRFVGIVERNMSVISLYLERFFSYLDAHGVKSIQQITGANIHGFLRYISGFSNQSKDHMMRTVRQFLGFCYQNGQHNEDLTGFAPVIHYEKRSRIPSSYSYDDVIKLLKQVDRSNPVGKRNYLVENEYDIVFHWVGSDVISIFSKADPQSIEHIFVDFGANKILPKYRPDLHRIDEIGYNYILDTPVISDRYVSLDVSLGEYNETFLYDRIIGQLFDQKDVDPILFPYPNGYSDGKYYTLLNSIMQYHALVGGGFPEADELVESHLKRDGTTMIVYHMKK